MLTHVIVRDLVSYIVYLGAHKHGLNTTDIDLDFVTNSHHEFLGSYLGSNEKAKENIFYSYTMHINGFAAMLEEEEAAEIAKNPDIVSVFLNKGRQLHTTPSWDFLGVEKNGVIGTDSIWSKARFGQDTIIGNLDTGVWPESKSFSDEGMGPIPSKWRGICQHGTHDRFRCNRKVIGARYFNKGYAAFVGNLNSNFHTVRDHAGHGSHTLSTAAGSFVPGASIFSNGNGTAKGGSPKAHVAAYKVCWPQINGNECFDADIMAAFDAAISDGVDVLSLSLGGKQSEFFEDGISIGSFHAVKKGIVVVASAGNSGPTPESVTNVSPWMFTVGASTMDREFRSYVTLGNKKQLKGASLSSRALSSQKFYPLISGETAKASNALAEEAILCKAETLDPKKVKGKLLVCVRGDNARADKGQQAALAGAVGMILVNDELSGNEIMADPHLLPASHINFEDGKTVLAYINSSKTPMAYITRVKTTLGTNPAPIMASFSSRGPNLIEPTILKPDITAPGVSVIAAFSEAVGPSEQTFDKRRVSFNSQSGTSMSCPHVAGVAGLLKTLHPDMSPAAIKSAIMTTATVQDNNMKPILDSTNHLANPFSYGAGHVSPNRAMDPGLVYDLTVNDYLNFLCARGYKGSFIKLFLEKPYICPKSFSLVDFNYPSITVPDLPIPGTVTITRRVKNVGSPGTYNAHVTAPEGIIVSVSPRSLKFKRTSEEKIFNVKFECKSNIKPELPNGFVFGHLMWSDGKHYVKSPLVVRANLTN
ncbi:Peptidase_S8 domain-containing protein/PA domain-containing protein/Inhibitor_I9 domain-containing protein [Cephalotus follicularis]|uniref:Peptidase_S8 domain-containing protein/PA domain-containing protein/Inhibitor_I9 domain-containing protein n=1 Tax=Cephalotus follicularis TaxID=3775 RepID=A0A1Q3DD49_CEPFO|nr:Peptidase_S8 domain-containing protein/PA domain-containing protein/Inhibitor_I9 domain-containing protein [Cephalotus follicularis]